MRRAYGWLHRRSPAGLRGRLAKAAFVVGNKPTVGARPPEGFDYPGRRNGCLVLVADFELAWAWRFAIEGASSWEEIAARERRNVPEILSLLDARGVPATWATVGHLMLGGCRKDPATGRLHANLPRMPFFKNRVWRFDSGGWFDDDPATAAAEEPLWYAPDLVRVIRQSPVGHEIGCHTFSHIDMSDELCPDDVAEAEVAECVNIARGDGLELRSFVFPGGTYGHQGVLARHGFITYRKRGVFDLAFPQLDRHGLVVLGSSTGLDDDGYGWSAAYYVGRLERYLLKAVETRTVCVFWFHPSMSQWFLKNVFPPLLDLAAILADEGKLWIATMTQCASHCLPYLKRSARA